MRASAIRAIAMGIVVSACLILASCSGGDAPREGTPAFYWAAAGENFAKVDYLKTLQHLERLTASDNEFTVRAQPWLLVMTSGMARGYMDLADNFEAGARATKGKSTDFRRRVNNYRGEANRLAIEFVEVFDKFQRGKDDPIPIAVPPPTGSTVSAPQLSNAAAGFVLAPADVEATEKRAIERGVLLAVCNAAGAPEDAAKTRALLKPGNLTVPRAALVKAMANTLYEESQLYGPGKRDDSEKFKLFCNRALEALKTIPETKETKDLSLKITKSLKKT